MQREYKEQTIDGYLLSEQQQDLDRYSSLHKQRSDHQQAHER